jgi:hypothetical protein
MKAHFFLNLLAEVMTGVSSKTVSLPPHSPEKVGIFHDRNLFESGKTIESGTAHKQCSSP